MNKFVIKTALLSLAVIAAAALLIFSMWILISPQSMASACEKTGNYSFAVTCADLRYKYTGNTQDLARCAEDGIMSGNDKYIVRYGEKLISDEEAFKSLCAEKDTKLSQTNYGDYTLSYNSYIRGRLAAAQYREGDATSAILTAKGDSSGQSFISLVLEIAAKQDKQAAEGALSALSGLEQTEQVLNLTDILEKI